MDACPLCSILGATCGCFAHLSGQIVLWDQRTIAYPLCSSNQKMAVMHLSDPKSYNQPFVLIMFPRFWLYGPMVWLYELLLTRQVTYNDSLAL